MEENEMPENKSSKHQPPRFDRSDLLSILAVVVSLSALGVSIYEARILREQSALMQQQQKASVWPYIEVMGSYNYNERVEVRYAFKNKGVGPARIKSFSMSIDGKEFPTYLELKEYFTKVLPGSHDLSVFYGGLGGVIAADEKEEVFYLSAENFPEAQDIISQLKFKYEICYCSIYDDCWHLDSDTEKPIAGCPN